MRSQTRGTIEIVNGVGDGNRLAAELQSQFVALEDAPDFTAGPMKKGSRIFIKTAEIALHLLQPQA